MTRVSRLAAFRQFVCTTSLLLPVAAATAAPADGNGFGPAQVEQMLSEMHAPTQPPTATEVTLISFSDTQTTYQTPSVAVPVSYTTVADQWWDLQIGLSESAAASGGGESASGQSGRLERLERVELLVDNALDNMVAQLPDTKSAANQTATSVKSESDSLGTASTGSNPSTGSDSGASTGTVSSTPSSSASSFTISSTGFVGQSDLDLVLLNWGDSVTPAGFDGETLSGTGPFEGLVSQNELDGVLLNWGSGNSTECNADDPLSNLTNCTTPIGTPQCTTGVGHSSTMTTDSSCPNP